MALQQCLEQVADPRRAEGRRYGLVPLLLFSILAIASGATSYRKVQRFMAAHWPRLTALLGVKWKRAPAHTTIRYLLHKLDPQALEAAFRAHSQALLTQASKGGGRCIALDGKTLKGSFDHFADQKAAQFLGALAQEPQLILAPVAPAEKSNEIPAAQALIRELGLENCLLTLDALHCQKKPLKPRPRLTMSSSCK